MMTRTRKKQVNAGDRRRQAGGDFVEIVSTGSLPLVRLSDIEFAPRPGADQGQPFGFFNPRPAEEVMEPSKFNKLMYSIRLEGLLEAPVVRVWTEGGKPKRVQHVAGERRLRCLHAIADGKLPCVDESAPKPDKYAPGSVVNWRNRFGVVRSQAGSVVAVEFDDHLNDTLGSGPADCPHAELTPTKPGDQLHEYVAVNVYYDIDDERAMRIAFSENDNSEPLSVKAEVDLVERYLASGKKQQEVAYLLNSNITFVSQRAAFRRDLPAGAFRLLMDGKMKANVGTYLLSLPAEHRQAAFDSMVLVERAETATAIRHHQTERERLLDEVDINSFEAGKAERRGDAAIAAKARRKAEVNAKKASAEAKRLERAKADSGTIKQGHAERGTASAGISPRKAKPLTREQVEHRYVRGLEPFVSECQKDQLTGEEIPCELAGLVRRTAEAIISGELDPVKVIRQHQIDAGVWAAPPGAGPAPRPKPKKSQRVRNVVEDDEEDDFEDDDFDDEEDDDGPSDLELEGVSALDDDDDGFHAEVSSRRFGSDRDWN